MSIYTKEIQVTSEIFHGYSTRKCIITILNHAIKNPLATKSNKQLTLGRSDAIPLAVFSVAWYKMIYFGMINGQTSEISDNINYIIKDIKDEASTLYLLTLRSWFITDIYQK